MATFSNNPSNQIYFFNGIEISEADKGNIITTNISINSISKLIEQSI